MSRLDFNVEPIIRRLGEATTKLADLTPVYQEIGEYFVHATRQRFLRGEAPDGTRWQPKKQATIERYKRRGDGNRPDPLIGPSKRLSTEIASLVSRSGVEVGSALEYSRVMQDGAAKGAFGTDARGRPLPWGGIPARVWLGLSEMDERNILGIVDEQLARTFDDEH